jgi:hypothetical protein
MCRGIEKYSSDYSRIERLAIKLALLKKGDVRIYAKEGQTGVVYDCETVLDGTNKRTEISIINFNIKP